MQSSKLIVLCPSAQSPMQCRLHWRAWLRVTLTLLVTMAACTQAAAAPSGANTKLSDVDARHLLTRTGFAATAAEINAFTGLTRAEAADRLLAASRDVAVTPPPTWVKEPNIAPRKLREMSQEAREAERKLNLERAVDLREWWFREMLSTPSPLTEKMTLFWHNHFATSQQKVKRTVFLYDQNVLLRKYALGDFRAMLHQIAKNPAMLIYLDNANSRKEQPNENFAREVMELFTLGEGNYTERDIKEMARAFTGWSLDRETGEFMFRRGFHDAGVKTIFGKRGNFEGDQALDLLLQRPECAQFITRKLWREFISPDPDEAEVNRLAAVYRDAGYSNAKLMRAMLTSDAFYAPGNRATLIKSPVEFVVGTMKLFDIQVRNLRPFVLQSALLGQNVFSPPNVKGWPGGEAWINSASLLGRKQFIDRLFKNDDRAEMRADTSMTAMNDMTSGDADGKMPPSAARAARQQNSVERAMSNVRWDLNQWASRYAVGKSPGSAADMSKILLAMAPREMPTAGTPAEWARQLVTDPAYQLK